MEISFGKYLIEHHLTSNGCILEKNSGASFGVRPKFAPGQRLDLRVIQLGASKVGALT